MGNPVILETPVTVARPVRRPRALAVGALLLILSLAALTRLAYLGADPPAWMQGAFISDEGWWADSARGIQFFGTPFADDFGTAYLVTPAYTWALEAIYKVCGVGTVQTRLLAAVSSLASILVVALLLWRAAGRRQALLAALMLTLSPYFWSYGRVGLQEPLQGLMITTSFALWVFSERSRLAALATGAAMGLALAVKPNAISLGIFPILLGVGGSFVVERARLAGPAGRTLLRRDYLIRAALALAGLFAVLTAIFFGHALPNWHRFVTTAAAEAGVDEATWRQRVTLPGMLMLSTLYRGTVNWPILWNPAHWSPALIVLLWLFLLRLVLALRAGIGNLIRLIEPLEAMALGWTLGILAVIGSAYYQPDRRYVLLFPPLALLGGLFLGRLPSDFAALSPPAPDRRRGGWFAFVLLLVLTLPLLILVKPAASLLIMKLAVNVHVGRDPGLNYAASATLFMMGWLAGLAVLAPWVRPPAEKLGEWLGRRRAVLCLVVPLLVLEAGVLGLNMVHPPQTMIRQQTVLAGIVKEGETVLGHVATTIFMPLRVRTVRRVSRYEGTPPPNPDIWDRLHPRYLIEMTGRNYEPATPLYKDLVEKGAYHPLYAFGLGPYRGGVPRYTFQLYERQP